jgi:LPS-assembly protein
VSKHSIAAALVPLLLGLSPVLAEKPQLSSDRDIEFDAASGSTVARGNATLTHGELTVVADEIRYSARENKARASGNIRLNYGTYRLVGQGLTYDIGQERVASEAFRLGMPPLLAMGDGFSGNREQIEVDNAAFYYGEPHFSAPNIRVRHATLYPGDRIEADSVTIRIGNIPVFYLPHLSRPVDDLGVTMAGSFGYRGNLGLYTRLEGLFPFSKSGSIGANLDGYSERGVLVGPKLAVAHASASSNLVSSLDSGWIKDSGDPGVDSRGDPIDRGRWFLDWDYRHHVGQNFSLLAKIEAWSDSETLRDFRPDAYAGNQDPDSYLEAVFRGQGFFLSAFTRVRPNDFQAVHERLPEVRFDWMPREIAGSGFFHSVNASAAHLRETLAPGATTGDRLYLQDFGIPASVAEPVIASNRFLFHYKVQRPVKLNQWLSFVPLVGLQAVSYTDQQVDWVGVVPSEGFSPSESSVRPEDLTRIFGEVGFDMELKAYATWDYRNEIWGIDGLRHILRPVARFRYYFGGNDESSPFVRIDRRVFSTNLPPVDLGNIRYVDDLGESSTLRFGIENLLQTRDSDYGSRNLVELNLYQDVLFNADPGADTWAGLYTQLAVNPIHWLSFDFYSLIRPESFTVAASRAQLSVINGDLWRLAIDTESLDDQVEQYRFAFNYRFNDRWGGSAQIRFDAHRNDITEQVYTLQQRLANTWNLAYQLVFRSGTSREDETQFNIRATLVQF